MENGQRIWIDIFPKKTYTWPTSTWKGAQHHSSSGKCKSKPKWDITSHLLVCLISKREELSTSNDVEKMEPLCTIVGNVSWCNNYGKQYGSSSKNKIKIELPYDPEISTSGYISKGKEITILICTPMFIEALFTITKTWKHLSIPWWMNVYIYIIYIWILFSHIKKETLSFATA